MECIIKKIQAALARFASKVQPGAMVRHAFGMLSSSMLQKTAIGFITDGTPFVRAHVEPCEALGTGNMLFVGWSYLIEVGEDGRAVGVVVNDDRTLDLQAFELSLEELDPSKEAVLWADPGCNALVFAPDTGDRYR